MTSRHFIDDPALAVNQALASIPLTNPDVSLDAENKIIYRSSRPEDERRVALVSGGGSGHEPSFAAFVGRGLLNAAVAGTIFASPGTKQIRDAIMNKVEGGGGVLVIVMNYTGDVLNFGLAVEMAKAAGRRVEMVVVGDDVGVGRDKGGKVGRRGIAGTVLVHKIAGALAATGASLEQVSEVARLVCQNLVSVGASLSHVHVPGHAVADTSSEESMGSGEIEIGMGIHNEPGSHRLKKKLPGLVREMLQQLLDTSDKDRSFLAASNKAHWNRSLESEFVLLVNNLGGVSMLEFGAITFEVARQLKQDWQLNPVRIFSGTYMTSLNGLGFSITLLRIEDTGLGAGKKMLDLLDAPSEATGWSASIKAETWARGRQPRREELADKQEKSRASFLRVNADQAARALTAGLRCLVDAEPDITKYDTAVGDGDCGVGLKRGAEAVLGSISKDIPDDAALLVSWIAQAVESSMDGTSGALYAIFLNALASALAADTHSSPTNMTPTIWADALQQALQALGKYTPAQPGDRTLMDALHPFVNVLKSTGQPQMAAEAAKDGARGTAGMHASLGRTVYVGGNAWEHTPDPGAYGLSVFLSGFCGAL